MNTEEHDDLWDLLGKARTPDVSPFFSRNVLRAIREEATAKPGLFAWLRRHWQLTTASTCAVALAVGLTFVEQSPKPDSDPVMLLAQQVSASPDYQVINHLDELLASEESSVWLEK
jgi:hypothetical protein